MSQFLVYYSMFLQLVWLPTCISHDLWAKFSKKHKSNFEVLLERRKGGRDFVFLQFGSFFAWNSLEIPFLLYLPSFFSGLSFAFLENSSKLIYHYELLNSLINIHWIVTGSYLHLIRDESFLEQFVHWKWIGEKLQIKREIATLKLLKHPNVVRLYEVLRCTIL